MHDACTTEGQRPITKTYLEPAKKSADGNKSKINYPACKELNIALFKNQSQTSCALDIMAFFVDYWQELHYIIYHFLEEIVKMLHNSIKNDNVYIQHSLSSSNSCGRNHPNL